jgi:adhesin transport system outer membrane protein
MSWNFSTGGEQFARIRRSKYSHKEAQSRQREIQRQIEQNVKLSYNEYNTSARQLELLKQRQDLNEKLFATYQSQFEGARVNLLQLMQAHNQLFNTNLESVNGHYRYLAAQYGVLASMGQLQNALNVQAPAKVSSLTHEKK